MITIIEGNEDFLKKTNYFRCNTCGWTGKADIGEYEYCGSQIEGDDWRVLCPCCNRLAYTIKDEECLAGVKDLESKRDTLSHYF